MSGRSQRVVIDGSASSWSPVETGVPQGSILGPLLFLVYTNDIVNYIQNDIYLYADDTSLLSISDDAEIAAMDLNADLYILQCWAKTWHMTFNPSKTVYLPISKLTSYYPIYLNGVEAKRKLTHCHLGLTFETNMKWSSHIQSIVKKANKRLGILQRLKFSLSRQCLERLYQTMILPILDYGDVVYDKCSAIDCHRLEVLHNRAARIVSGAMVSTNTIKLLHEELGWETLKSRRERHKLCIFYSIVHQDAPRYLTDCLPHFAGSSGGHQLRHHLNLRPFKTKTSMFQGSFFPSSVKLWNNLHDSLKHVSSSEIFKRCMKSCYCPPPPPAYYGCGDRWLSISLTKLRLGHNSLNRHLFKIGIKDDPSCECGCCQESELHYILECPKYIIARTKLMRAVYEITRNEPYLHHSVTHKSSDLIAVLLKGSDRLSLASNQQIFAEMHSFIRSTGRFDIIEM